MLNVQTFKLYICATLYLFILNLFNHALEIRDCYPWNLVRVVKFKLFFYSTRNASARDSSYDRIHRLDNADFRTDNFTIMQLKHKFAQTPSTT